MASAPDAPRPWRPCGVVSLLTDYGLADPYVGIVKGVLWRDAPRLRAARDLTHAIPPGDVAGAAFLLERSWASFPAGCVLSTGTGIVPPDEFSLRRRDEVRITIDAIGTLSNAVA